MDPQALLRENPGKSLDFKRDALQKGELLGTVVAFANAAGGTILVGVDPADRQVRGVTDPLALAERLERWLARGVHPRAPVEVEVHPWRQTHLVCVRVHPGPQPPYALVTAPGEGRVLIRAGVEDREADEEMVRELRRRAQGGPFDEQICADASPEDLDRPGMERAFARAGRTVTEADLLELRVLAREGEDLHPTTGGLLLFGRRRLERFPDAWIQAARFRGNDRAVILDGAELQGDLPSAVEEAMAFALRNLTRGSAISGLRRADEHAVPPVALREALVNAVVHADYSQRGAPIRLALHDDRAEITSPGLLPPGLTLPDLDHGVSRLRNRVLGRVFFALGLVEQWGSGVGRMRRAMAEAGLPPPVLRVGGHSFRVILETVRGAEPLAEGKDEIILDLLAAQGALSTSAVAAQVGLSDRATRTRLRNLVERGLVTEIGSGPNDPQRKYALLNRRR